MSYNDIPSELLCQIRERFESEPRVHRLRIEQQRLAKCGRYRDALEVARGIDVLFGDVVGAYLEESSRQVESIDLSESAMSSADKERMMRLLLVCFMCADVIESSIIDMDDVLHRYDRDMYMEMFNDLRDVLRLCRGKLKYFQEHSGYMKDLVWGERCDDMYAMMCSKAGAIMRKRASDPNYGRNSERFGVYVDKSPTIDGKFSGV